jgi:hypothetical protein
MIHVVVDWKVKASMSSISSATHQSSPNVSHNPPTPSSPGTPPTSLQNIVPKLPSRHISLKHNIQLLIRPSLHLRNPIPTPDQARQTQPSKEESQLALQICLVGINKIGNGYRHDDADNGLHGGRDGDGFGADARGAYFAEDGVGDGTDTAMC